MLVTWSKLARLKKPPSNGLGVITSAMGAWYSAGEWQAYLVGNLRLANHRVRKISPTGVCPEKPKAAAICSGLGFTALAFASEPTGPAGGPVFETFLRRS
jgi:hypothetical protein